MTRCMFVWFLLFGVTACSQQGNSKTFFIDFEEVENLTTKSPVTCKGIQVGKISSLKLDNRRHIIAEVEIDNNLRVTEEDTFALVWLDPLGTRGIELISNGTGKYLSHLDSAKGVVINKIPVIQVDSLGSQIVRDSVFGVRK